jgi:hypothetical protein
MNLGAALSPRLGGIGFLLFIPMLIVGTVLFGRIGISSGSAGSDAMRRIADAGATFPIMNALFHLGALLLVPGAIALLVVLRGADRGGSVSLGTAFLLLAVAVGAGFVFSLNHGLYREAAAFRDGSAEQQVVLAAMAESNLRTQAGAELVQSVGLGLWVVLVSTAMVASDWPAWVGYLGLAGGIGFILAGLSSVLIDVPGLGVALGGLGALGLVLFAVWLVVVGFRLMTMPLAA